MSRHIMGNNALRMVGAYDTEPMDGKSMGGKDDLWCALQWMLNHNGSIVGWRDIDGVLHLYWFVVDMKINLFLSPITTADEAYPLVRDWLARQPMRDELSAGSDTNEGSGAFQAWTDGWGHGGGDDRGSGDHYCALAIKPRTRWIGK
jgi:hypothetical protein